MKLIAGVDIGNSTTEVCVGSVGEDGSFRFLASASRVTTGTKGTLPNVHGIRAALEDVLRRKPVSTPGPVCTLHRAAAKVLPEGLLMDVWEILRKI